MATVLILTMSVFVAAASLVAGAQSELNGCDLMCTKRTTGAVLFADEVYTCAGTLTLLIEVHPGSIGLFKPYAQRPRYGLATSCRGIRRCSRMQGAQPASTHPQ